MKKIISIIGARPQIIKSAALTRVCMNSTELKEVVVHTQQHYSDRLSSDLIRDLAIPEPAIKLPSPSGNSLAQIAHMIVELERVFVSEKPDAVVVYGDTNSTIAASIVAAHLSIPLAHIESGLRSFNREMPEEINRIVTDHLSTLLFCPSTTASKQLLKEGFSTGAATQATAASPLLFECGDIMFDNALHYGQNAPKPDLENYIFLTLHRPSNVDNPEALISFLKGLLEIALELNLKIMFPIHPRTLKNCVSSAAWEELSQSEQLQLTEPLPYTETMGALKHAHLVWTDSGGLCKEAFMMGTPCLILRSETEWVELVENGYAQVVHNDLNAIKEESEAFLKNGMPAAKNLYGDGHAAQFIHDTLVQYLNS